MRINKGIALSVGLLASIGLGIAQPHKFRNFPLPLPSRISNHKVFSLRGFTKQTSVYPCAAFKGQIIDFYVSSMQESLLSSNNKYKDPSIGIIGAEFLGATVGAAVMSIFTGILPGYIYDITHPFQVQPSFGLAIALIGGYCLGFPLGSALGTYYTGKLLHQNGTLWGSLIGGTIGMAMGVGALFFQPYSVPLTLTLPQIGSIGGYNLLRKSPQNIREQGCLPLFPESRVCSKNSGIKVILLSIKF